MIKDKCYIYGSIHILLPHLENALDKVDVVLLEGFLIREWEKLVRKDPVTIVSILGVLFSLLVEKIAFGIARWYYKVFRGIEFKGDMFSVATLAKERGKIIERTDSDFHEVYALKKSVYVEIFTIFILFLVGIPLLVVILLTLFIEIIITANGIFSWEYFIQIFQVGIQSGILVMMQPGQAFKLATLLVTGGLLLSGLIFAYRTIDIRDSKVVERATELVNSGKTVLIVRGKMHVKGIVRELEKRGIYCKEIN
jgi:hypothetical protein